VTRADDQHQYLTSFLINDTLAVDAGCLGFVGAPAAQALVKHLLVTHSHVDHLASLPIFLENAYEAKQDCVTVHGSQAVLDCLQRDLFNGRVWPDFIALSLTEAPFLKLHRFEAGQSVELGGLRITSVAVNHVVPTTGFIIEEPGSAVVIVSDTGPTEEIWKLTNATANVKAVFLEACFPNAMTDLAIVSRHLTPAMLAQEVKKLTKPVRVIAVHIKARFREQVVQELVDLALPSVEVGRMGHTYWF
jgi:ribonuclease BN (tRNA processing enzyme)